MLYILIKLICILIGMSFLTLLERKYLGYLQIRKGPNKVSIMGLLQPIADAVKLMSKNKQSPYLVMAWVFYLSPVLSLVLANMVWGVLSGSNYIMNVYFNMIVIVVFLSVGIYSLLASGWVSNSKYSFLGAYRAIAQTISYEVAFIFIYLTPMFMMGYYNSSEISSMMKVGMSVWVVLPIVLFMWYVSCLAETNRAPFDFAEGESELVSGFNIEYSSFEFALLFMAEYTSILFMCMLTCFLFGCESIVNKCLVFFVGVSIFIFARGSYPRYRYDQLMLLVWKSFLLMVMVFMLAMCWLLF